MLCMNAIVRLLSLFSLFNSNIYSESSNYHFFTQMSVNSPFTPMSVNAKECKKFLYPISTYLVCTMQILNNIIPFISKDERYNLFIIVDKILPGNYLKKAQILEVKQSAYYRYKKRDLEISDEMALRLLRILSGDQEKFTRFLDPILSSSMKQIQIIKDCVNSGFFGIDFNLSEKLFDIYRRERQFREVNKI